MDFNVLLINEVFKRKPLWDQKHRQHHHRFVLNKLWDEVAIKLKSTRDVVRSKWKAMRDSYRRELKKLPENYQLGGKGFEYVPSWPYFEQLNFLLEQITGIPSSENVSVYQSAPVEVDIEDIEADLNLNERSEHSVETVVEFDTEREVNTKVSTKMKRESQDPLSISQEREVSSKKMRRENQDSLSISHEDPKIELLQKQNMAPQDDDDQLFVNSLVPHMRTLPVRDKLLLRLKMQELVYKFVCNVGSQKHGAQAQHRHFQQLDYSNPPGSHSGPD